MTIEYKKQIYANNARSTVASNIGANDVSISVADGSRFPQPGPGEFFLLTLDNGVDIEVVEVHRRLGNVMADCVRGREGTVAQPFQSGTRAENRVTAGTLSAFARLQDRNAPLPALSDLGTPESSNNNTYLISQTDDGGSPILAISAGNVWRFPTYAVTRLANVLSQSGTTTSVPYFGIDNFVWLFRDRSFIIQFTSGQNRGQCRFITTVTESSCGWEIPLPSAPAAGDGFEIYQSTSSRFQHVLPEVIDLGDDYDSAKSSYSGTYLGLTQPAVFTTDGGFF